MGPSKGWHPGWAPSVLSGSPSPRVLVPSFPWNIAGEKSLLGFACCIELTCSENIENPNYLF
jgi:hypothetical protein